MTQEELYARDLEFKNLRKSKTRIISDIVKNADEHFISWVNGLYDLYSTEWDELVLLKVLFDTNEWLDRDIYPYQIKYLDDLVRENIKDDNEYFWYSVFLRQNTFYITIEIYTYANI